MPRTFTFTSLVRLPRLDTPAAIALGSELLAASRAEKRLPRTLFKAHALLERRLRILRDASAERLSPKSDTARPHPPDRALDAAWSGLFDWLSGWSKLPAYLPQTRDAAAIRRELFPDGLKFILLPHKRKWAESEARMTRIRNDRLAAPLRALGGNAFLDTLRTAHKEFGEAIGMAGPVAPPLPARNLRGALDDFGFALRAYVVKVTAQVDDDRPETRALAEKLLAPLTAWQPPRADKRAGISAGIFEVDGILRAPPPDDMTLPESAPDHSCIICKA